MMQAPANIQTSRVRPHDCHHVCASRGLQAGRAHLLQGVTGSVCGSLLCQHSQKCSFHPTWVPPSISLDSSLYLSPCLITRISGISAWDPSIISVQACFDFYRHIVQPNLILSFSAFTVVIIFELQGPEFIFLSFCSSCHSSDFSTKNRDLSYLFLLHQLYYLQKREHFRNCRILQTDLSSRFQAHISCSSHCLLPCPHSAPQVLSSGIHLQSPSVESLFPPHTSWLFVYALPGHSHPSCISSTSSASLLSSCPAEFSDTVVSSSETAGKQGQCSPQNRDFLELHGRTPLLPVNFRGTTDLTCRSAEPFHHNSLKQSQCLTENTINWLSRCVMIRNFYCL